MRQRFIQSFSTSGDVQTAIDGGQLGKPYVVYLENEERIDWNSKEVTPPLSAMPLTFEIISAGTIIWKAQNTAYTTTIEYSLDNGETWTSITSNTEASAPSISVSAGDVIQFRGNNTTYASGNSRYNCFSGSTAKFEVEGNIMSLINSSGFETAATLTETYTFSNLFRNCTGLTSAENLVLPATTLVTSCYSSMFLNCKSLTTAPSLPATTLSSNCYEQMFQGCTSLTSAPELPATTLGASCYRSMFQDCSSLTTAPSVFPATTFLVRNCYDSMFLGCTSLTQAPELPATKLVNYCYNYMFYKCKSLNYIKCLATNISASRCIYNWLGDVPATGTFVKHPDAVWPSGTSGIPDGWTVEDAVI